MGVAPRSEAIEKYEMAVAVRTMIARLWKSRVPRGRYTELSANVGGSMCRALTVKSRAMTTKSTRVIKEKADHSQSEAWVLMWI